MREPGDASAQTSFERAARAAGKFDSIDTDHLLLGLTDVHGALAMKLLERLGVSASAIRARLPAEGRRRAKSASRAALYGTLL
jgi:hypothetical protein